MSCLNCAKLQQEVEWLRATNESVRVCKDHTFEVADPRKTDCLVCEVERLRRTQDALKEWALDHKRLIEYVCESHPMPLIMQGWLAEARGEGDE
jgi:hypothetical protein